MGDVEEEGEDEAFHSRAHGSKEGTMRERIAQYALVAQGQTETTVELTFFATLLLSFFPLVPFALAPSLSHSHSRSN